MSNKNNKFFNKSLLGLMFILLVGVAFRLMNLNKPDGLWNDEYVSWYVASVPFGKSFVSAIFAQCHMPFYYLYLKFFIHFFGNSDLMLRWTSVVPGVLSILSMYFVGKELESKNNQKLGELCAGITAISSFLIYYSQEVRFYSLLFLFSSLALLFTLRLIKNKNKSNLINFIIFNFLIFFTHTLGIIFVLFNLVFVTYCLIKSNENYKKNIIVAWASLGILTVLLLPLMFVIFTGHPLSQWWGHFSLSKLGFLLTDYFTPVLTNLVNAPDKFFYNLTFGFILFAIIPMIISISGLVRGLCSKKYEILGIFYVSLAFLAVLLVMAISGKMLLITKYTIEIYPTLILIMAFGLLEYRSWLSKTLIFIFFFLNLTYLMFDYSSAPRMNRPEGHKLVASLLKSSKLNKGDYILLTYYPKTRFEKYFNFSGYNVYSIDKKTFGDYLGIKNQEDFAKIQDSKFDKKFNDEILSKMKQGQKLSVLILNDVSLFSPVQMGQLFADKKSYNKTPFLFMVFSQVKNDVIRNCLIKMQISRLETKGAWSVVTFVKK